MQSNNQSILLTGASGFVGGHVLQLLLDQRFNVRAYVRNHSRAKALEALGIDVFTGDLTDKKSVSLALRGITAVIHIAAAFRQAGVPDAHYFDVNVSGTKNLLDACVAAGVSKFIHCSTVGVLGDVQTPPANEFTPYNPGDVYQESKTAAERLVLEYFASGKMKGVVIRPAMVYGPGDMRTLKLFRMIQRGVFFYVGDGSKAVHFVDVRDLAHSFLLALDHADSCSGSVYIIAGGRSLPLRELVETIALELGVSNPFLRIPVRPMQLLGSLCEALCKPLGINPPIFRRRVDFFTKTRAFDFSKARSELGFMPTKNYIQEVRDIIDWYQTHEYLPHKAHSVRPRDNISYNELHTIPDSFENRLGPTELVSGSRLVMARGVSGDIHFWNPGAERNYGWSDLEAQGTISHDLLKTEFPAPLAGINEDLLRTGRWSGELLHMRKDGSRIRVRSDWTINGSAGKDGVVLEVNHPLR